MVSKPYRPLILAWLALVLLSLFSLGLGQWSRSLPALPWLVAAIIWLKGAVVARCFLESRHAHPFIRRLLEGFILIPPLALLLTVYFGPQLARWASL